MQVFQMLFFEKKAAFFMISCFLLKSPKTANFARFQSASHDLL